MNPDLLNDQCISYHESRRGGIIARLVRKCTAWAWKHQVHAPIDRMYERGLINSRVLHEAKDYASRIINQTPPMPLYSANGDSVPSRVRP